MLTALRCAVRCAAFLREGIGTRAQNARLFTNNTAVRTRLQNGRYGRDFEVERSVSGETDTVRFIAVFLAFPLRTGGSRGGDGRRASLDWSSFFPFGFTSLGFRPRKSENLAQVKLRCVIPPFFHLIPYAFFPRHLAFFLNPHPLCEDAHSSTQILRARTAGRVTLSAYFLSVY